MQPVQVMKTAAWKTTDELPLSSESLAMMFAQQVPIIRIPNFATPEECNVLVEAAEKLGFDAYESVTPQIDRIGLTVFEYDKTDKSAYFQAVVKANTLQRRITSVSFHPLERMMAKIRACTDKSVRIASELKSDG